MITTFAMAVMLMGQQPDAQAKAQPKADAAAEREQLIAKRKLKAMTPQQRARLASKAREAAREEAEREADRRARLRSEEARKLDAASYPRVNLGRDYTPGTEMLVWPGVGGITGVAKNYFVAIDMLKLMYSGDKTGLAELIRSSKVAPVSHRTRFLVIDTHRNIGFSGYDAVEGRILDGPLAGERVWISRNMLAFRSPN